MSRRRDSTERSAAHPAQPAGAMGDRMANKETLIKIEDVTLADMGCDGLDDGKVHDLPFFPGPLVFRAFDLFRAAGFAVEWRLVAPKNGMGHPWPHLKVQFQPEAAQ